MSESEQVRFWRGAFGEAYISRNEATPERLRPAVRMWGLMLRAMEGAPPASILEVGANIGINLRALSTMTDADLFALEPNDAARARLVADKVVGADRAMDGAADRIPLADGAVDLAFTSGVLIHIAPDDLAAACREIHRVARRYVLSIEYFAHRPETVPYRGQSGQLFKRDFGRYWLENFPDLEIVDFGFFWQPVYGVDNLNWWLFRKSGGGR